MPFADPTAPNAPDKAALARAVNELEAAKVRVERDAKAVAAETRKQLVGELLPVLDNVDRAIAAADPDSAEGIQLVKRQLEAVLRGYGVERVDATGAAFDPKLHEAITTLAVADPAQHRRVVDQIEPGYRFGDQLLRPAKVVVGALARAPEESLAEQVRAEPAPVVAAQPAHEELPELPRLDPRFFRQPSRVDPRFARREVPRDPFAAFRVPTRRSRW